MQRMLKPTAAEKGTSTLGADLCALLVSAISSVEYENTIIESISRVEQARVDRAWLGTRSDIRSGEIYGAIYGRIYGPIWAAFHSGGWCHIWDHVSYHIWHHKSHQI